MGSTREERALPAASRPQTWLVTGAAGFIGSHLVEELLRRGQDVVGLDNFATGSRENLRLVEQGLGSRDLWRRFRLIEADIRDVDACARACEGADFVLHQAALGSVPRSIEKPLDTHATNVDGTLYVFLAARKCGVRRVVYASSSSVYGDDPGLPKVEDRLGRPLSPYALSKRIGESYAAVLGLTHGLSAVGLRYFNVVGPRQDPIGPYAAVVPRWVAAFARGERPTIFGDGKTTRDFCPVQNVVRANLLAATADGSVAGRAYNIALGSRTSLDDLFFMIRSGMAERGFDCAALDPVYDDFRPGDVRHSEADIGAARRDLGYEPVCSFAESMEEVMDFFSRAQAHPSPADDGKR
jgi:UDP-N-acetylglucosamine 4-epimerase